MQARTPSPRLSGIGRAPELRPAEPVVPGCGIFPAAARGPAEFRRERDRHADPKPGFRMRHSLRVPRCGNRGLSRIPRASRVRNPQREGPQGFGFVSGPEVNRLRLLLLTWLVFSSARFVELTGVRFRLSVVSARCLAPSGWAFQECTGEFDVFVVHPKPEPLEDSCRNGLSD